MFGKRPNPDDPANFRSSKRVDPRGMSVVVDGAPAELLDYSEGGIRVRMARSARRTVLVEVYSGGRLIRKCAAVTAWERGDQTGFAFRPNLRIYEVETSERSYDRHSAPEEKVEEDPSRNKTGGVAGSALRKRLNL